MWDEFKQMKPNLTNKAVNVKCQSFMTTRS